MGKKRILYFDVLNVLACFCVILLHHNGIVHTFTKSLAWSQALVVEVIAYWAVPIFFMISGATLMNYRERMSTKEFLIKRFCRVGIPWIVASIFIIYWRVWEQEYWLGPLTIKRFLEILLFNKQESTYWFFIPMLMIYLCIPALSVVAYNKNVMWYMFLIGFCTISLFPILGKWFQIPYSSALQFPLLGGGGYLIFTILGYLLEYENLSKKKRYFIYISGIIGAIIRYSYTFISSYNKGEVDKILFEYVAFPSVMLAAAVFVFAKYHTWERYIESEKWQHKLKILSSYSFGIYLIHKIVMYYYETYLHFDKYSLKWRLIMPFVTYITCAIIIFIGKQLKQMIIQIIRKKY